MRAKAEDRYWRLKTRRKKRSGGRSMPSQCTGGSRRRQHITDGIDQRLNGVGIMAVVGDDCCGEAAVASPDVR